MDGKIYASIIAAMADIEPIAKGQKNEKQGFSFRGVDVIMNELQPILKKHGLFIVPKVVLVTRSEKATNSGGVLLYSVVTMEYTMYAVDGSFVVGSTVGEGMDSGDKASNKAMSVALKYFLLQTFCIPTDDAKDPDFDSHDIKSDLVVLKNAVIDYLALEPCPYNDDWKSYADGRCKANDIEGLKKCIDVAKRVIAKKQEEGK